MDSLSGLYQKSQDLRDACESWCQKNEEKLSLCCDYSGNQNALVAKEEKLKVMYSNSFVNLLHNYFHQKKNKVP